MYNQLAIEQLNEPLLYLQSWEFRLTLFYPSLYSKSFWIFGLLVTNIWYCTGGQQMVSSQLTPLPKLACTAAAAFLPQPILTLEAVFDLRPSECDHPRGLAPGRHKTALWHCCPNKRSARRKLHLLTIMSSIVEL